MEKKEITPQLAIETICYHALSKSGLTAEAYSEIQTLRAGLMNFLSKEMQPKPAEAPDNVLPMNG